MEQVHASRRSRSVDARELTIICRRGVAEARRTMFVNLMDRTSALMVAHLG